MTATALERTRTGSAAQVDWPAMDLQRVAQTVLVSRALDELEESRLLPERKVLYQFTARGHDVTQALLGQMLTGARDGVGVYYRSRPLMLALGLTIEDALASTMMRSGSVSEGRDIGVVFNLPRREGPCVLPACGGVGAQYTPVIGWAQSLQYRAQVLRDEQRRRQHRCRAWRRSFGRDQRLLGGAHDRDDAAIAGAVLPRGQRLRHLGEVGVPDARRQHRRESRGVPQPEDPRRRQRGSARGGRDDRGGGRRCSRRRRAGAAATARAAARRATPVRTRRPTSLPTRLPPKRSRDPLVRLREQLVPSTISEEAWRALETRAREDVQRALGSVEQRPAARRRKRHALCIQRGERRRRARRAAAGRVVERRHRAARTERRPCTPKARASTW